ncbi:MAG: hypothetical protein IIT86_06425, partial [Oscillospiraceae bacterium]|nr:hypothetical protein [Oscillospiraceae bacterium]
YVWIDFFSDGMLSGSRLEKLHKTHIEVLFTDDFEVDPLLPYAIGEMNCTRVVIAHRLSTVQNCDRILCLDQGHIVEEGTYEELMQKDGFFAELVKRQQI